MAGLTLKASSLEKIFFGTHLEHRMRLHIGKRHCDEWIAHHCKPKDGGGDKRKFKKPSIRRKNKGARRQLKANDTIRILTSDHSRHWISAGYMTV